jgi:hypothetical protein
MSVLAIISENVCRGGVYPRPYDRRATIPDNLGVLQQFRFAELTASYKKMQSI